MAAYTVIAWNEYSSKPEHAKMVIKHEVEADSVTEALDKAQEMAANWNREETRDNMKVNLLTCDGYIRGV